MSSNVNEPLPADNPAGESGVDELDGIQWADDEAAAAHDAAAAAEPPPPEAFSAAAPESDAAADVDLDGGPATGNADVAMTVEDLVQDLERVTDERDQYLDASRRLQAEFENYKKAVVKREADARERANESLVTEILPVLDACDGAVANGAADVEPVRSALMGALAKQGLDRIDDAESPFDPSRHDAVIHEPDDEADGPVVAEVMRAGYSWKGRVVRPAMVRVRG
ncbi:MAG: nucleotide exchange factor GrpE [Actinomycetota bacterium]